MAFLGMKNIFPKCFTILEPFWLKTFLTLLQAGQSTISRIFCHVLISSISPQSLADTSFFLFENRIWKKYILWCHFTNFRAAKIERNAVWVYFAAQCAMNFILSSHGHEMFGCKTVSHSSIVENDSLSPKVVLMFQFVGNNHRLDSYLKDVSFVQASLPQKFEIFSQTLSLVVTLTASEK